MKNIVGILAIIAIVNIICVYIFSLNELKTTFDCCSSNIIGVNNPGWEFLDCYSKNDCRQSKWKNKKTGEIIEVIGMRPPQERLEIYEKKGK